MFRLCAYSNQCELLTAGMLWGIPTHKEKMVEICKLRSIMNLSIHPSIQPPSSPLYTERSLASEFLYVPLILGGIHWANLTWQRMLCPRQWVGCQGAGVRLGHKFWLAWGEKWRHRRRVGLSARARKFCGVPQCNCAGRVSFTSFCDALTFHAVSKSNCALRVSLSSCLICWPNIQRI